MRSLIIGILIFLAWSSIATWYYICHVNDFCGEPLVAEQVLPEEAEPDTTLVVEKEPVPPPEDAVVQFAYNSAQFIASESLKSFLSECKLFMEENPDALVNITGHTCSIGTASYNMDLGKRRAESVAGYFKDAGLPGNKIQTFSKGESEPVADNSVESGRVKNRRSEITVKY